LHPLSSTFSHFFPLKPYSTIKIPNVNLFAKKSTKIVYLPVGIHDIYTNAALRYSTCMTLYEFHLVFPEGETQEISHQLSPGEIVDVNGTPLPLPLPTNRMLAYHVSRKRTAEERGLVVTWYFLEQLSATELLAYT